MSEDSFINVLVAEDNEVSRNMMTGILQAQGYNVLGAVDGESAIRVVEDNLVDIALVDINMAPTGGFEFMKYVVSKGLKIPVVIITGDDSADLLTEASSLGVAKVIQKPVQPDRLLQTVQRILKRQGLNPAPLAVEGHTIRYSAEELMDQTIELAADNARRGRGGPYAALVATKEGQILGTGANGLAARVDPTAHAEVMAIRKAVEKTGRDDLSDCILYCSSQPTRVGEALIASVGIGQVYFGLSHEDTGQIKTHKQAAQPEYHQLCAAHALEMFKVVKKD
ncbi:MAG: response regulator [Rhodospirillales bacterium]|nr:response regulator [Alphaproteobacteria bacterium]MCB9981454.1 response regulator [Rhodospirillales bacterium]